MQKILPLVALLSILSVVHGVCRAEILPDVESASLEHEISEYSLPVVLAGARLRAIFGKPVPDIRVLAFTGSEFISIPFQIDLRDDQGKYVIRGDGYRSKEDESFDENDELVFMPVDAAKKTSLAAGKIGADQVAEIEILDPVSGERRWVYVIAGNGSYETSTRRYVRYEAKDDVVSSDIFRIGFSSEQPFILDKLNWRTKTNGGWSENLVDTMKLKHQGTMLGLIDFERNHADYSSELVAVKEGPIRVLRRTSNKVRILWWLRSPQVLIDYITHQNGFQMDVVIDIPFKIGMVFSRIETIASIDWDSDESLPPLTFHHSGMTDEMLVDGKMSAAEARMNGLADTDMVIANDYGQIFIQMTIPEGTPILKSVYYVDDTSAIDQPENIPGQFGNIGFRTYDWEKLEATVSHMYFNARLRPAM